MAEAIRGKGVISGIAIGKIMLAGQNLDGYLVNYQPESKEVEAKKAQDALTAVAETLRENIERLQKQEMVEQAAEKILLSEDVSTTYDAFLEAAERSVPDGES